MVMLLDGGAHYGRGGAQRQLAAGGSNRRAVLGSGGKTSAGYTADGPANRHVPDGAPPGRRPSNKCPSHTP